MRDNIFIRILKQNYLLYKAYQYFVHRNIYGKDLTLKYKFEDINTQFYNTIKGKSEELEHQIGRLVNFKRIINECSKLDGDFIEFGCWRGFSLLWIAYLAERNALVDRKLVGIDGFIGLPYTDGIHEKYNFSDTSLRLCKKNVLNRNILYDETIKNIYILQHLYREKEEILKSLRKLNITKFCFIHIDCDVGQSVIEIFELLVEEKLIADKSYILFDDYGLRSNLKPTVDKLCRKLEKHWHIRKHSSTRLTLNLYFRKKSHR